LLTQVLVYVTLVSLLGSMCSFAFNKSLRFQKRVAHWANDDAVTQGILRRIRRDVATALDAKTPDPSGTVLLLSQAGGQVRYTQAGERIHRIVKRPTTKTERPRIWRVKRTELRWSVESIAGRPAIVWTNVSIRDEITAKQRFVTRYARGVPVGSRLKEEARP
jgi:hypothetical protein